MNAIASITMDVRCEREGLLVALSAADAVVPSNSTKPILTNLKLEAGPGGLEIHATDLQVGIRTIVRRLEVIQPGQVVVPARQLVNILRESASPSAHLVLEATGDRSQLAVHLADGDYSIPAVVGEVFPPVNPFPEQGDRVTVPGDKLEFMIRKTSFAVDHDRTSAALSGVFLAVNEGELVMAATDGKVLCEAVHRDAGYTKPFSAILPAATINHLNRILASSGPRPTEIALSGKIAFVRAVIGGDAEGGAGAVQVELNSRLVDGTYPAYRNALPPSGQETITFATPELESAVRRTALMTANNARGIVAEVMADRVMFRNLNSAGGSARIPVQCHYAGPGLRLGLNAQYLGEILKVFSQDEVTIEYNGPGRGMIMREPGVTYLIMPISLPN